MVRHLHFLDRALTDTLAGPVKNLAVAIPPRRGKCLAQGTPVLMADGTWKPIEEVCRADRVISLDSRYQVTSQTVVGAAENGEKPVLRLTLFSGRRIDCTENHPLLTVHGWVEAGLLATGDSVAAVRWTPIPDGEPLPDGFAALMGYIIGDGSFGRGYPNITAADPAIVSHLGVICEAHGWFLRKSQKYTYRIVRWNRRGPRNGGYSAKERMRQYMAPSLSANKRVPSCIWGANKQDLVAFLAAYFNCDGTVTTCREGVAEYYSVSEGLLLDTQRLLTRLGVYSVLRVKMGRYKGAIHKSWRLIISGGDLVRFADHVPVIGHKGDRLRLLADEVCKRNHYPECDSIPRGWKNFTKNGIGWHRGHTGIRADKNYKRGTARHIVRKIAEAEDNCNLHRLCSDDIVWERIVAIECIGNRQTYDIEVESTHNFVADTVVVHNSVFCSQYLPAWFLGKCPDKRVMLASYEADFAASWGRRARALLEEYGWHFGVQVSARSSAADRWDIAGHEGGMTTAGVGGALTGRGADLMVIDDPIKNSEQSLSETYRRKMWEWYVSTARTRLEPGGSLLLIQTRWHWDDLMGMVLKEAQADGEPWRVVNFPALAEEGDLWRQCGEALWPERYSAEDLHSLRRTIGEYWFTSLYQQRPTPRSGGMFKAEWFVNRVKAAPYEARRVRYWDLGHSGGKGSANTAGTLLAVDSAGKWYVEHVACGQWEPDERDGIMLATAQRDRARYVNHEPAIWIEEEPSAGKDLCRHLARMLAGFRVFADKVLRSKELRAEPWSSQCAARNVYLVDNGSWDVNAWIEEHALFPLGERKDRVDSAASAFTRLAAVSKPAVPLRVISFSDRVGKKAKPPLRVVVCSRDALPTVVIEQAALLVAVRDPLPGVNGELPEHGLDRLLESVVLHFADVAPEEVQETWDVPLAPYGVKPAEVVMKPEHGKRLWQVLLRKRDVAPEVVVFTDDGEPGKDRRALTLAYAVCDQLRLPRNEIYCADDQDERKHSDVEPPNPHVYTMARNARAFVVG